MYAVEALGLFRIQASYPLTKTRYFKPNFEHFYRLVTKTLYFEPKCDYSYLFLIPLPDLDCHSMCIFLFFNLEEALKYFLMRIHLTSCRKTLLVFFYLCRNEHNEINLKGKYRDISGLTRVNFFFRKETSILDSLTLWTS